MTDAHSTPSRVSVVIAAYNEGPTIGHVVQECQRHTPHLAELVVVDDGSTDDTARRARNVGARVIQLGENRGKGHALRVGIDDTTGDIVVMLDGDGQDDPSEIGVLLDAMDEDVDLVIGSRFHGTFEPGAITPLHRVGSIALRSIMNVLFRTRISDPFAGFRAFRRDRLSRLSIRAERYDIEMDMLLELLRQGGRAVEVPVRRAPRPHGRTKLSTTVDGARILVRILRHRAALFRQA